MASPFSFLRQPLRVVVFLASATLLSGCQTLGSDQLVASSAPADLSAPTVSAVAGDLVQRLAEQLGQGKATIVLKSDSSAFGSALESSLRTWGYAVSTDQTAKDPKAISLAYVIVPVEGQIFARLSTETVEIGRVYTATQAGATPASPVSVMTRG